MGIFIVCRSVFPGLLVRSSKGLMGFVGFIGLLVVFNFFWGGGGVLQDLGFTTCWGVRLSAKHESSGLWRCKDERSRLRALSPKP